MTTPTPSHKTELQITGDAIAVTGEAMSDTGDGVTFEINESARDIWDPSAEVKVYENAVETTSGFEEQYLLGRIKFDSPPTTPVTVDVSYLPKFTATTGHAFNLSKENLTEETDYLGDDGKRRNIAKYDFTADFDQYELGENAIDAPTNTESTWAEIVKNGELVVVTFELKTDATPVPTIRSIGRFAAQDHTSDEESITTSNYQFEATQRGNHSSNLAFPRLYRFKA